MRIVGGEWGGQAITAPPGRQTRPTTERVREAWMSAVVPALGGAAVLDLFAGSGALGIEALSRGAAHATFVENATSALNTLRKNLDTLRVDPNRTTVVRADVFRFLDRLHAERFTIAFADPPYQTSFATRLAERFQARPFADLLCIEHVRSERIPVPGIWERRYGDTILTFLSADDAG